MTTEELMDTIAPRRRGKWVAGRTVGMVRRVASTIHAMTDADWDALSEAVEHEANVAADEAVESCAKLITERDTEIERLRKAIENIRYAGASGPTRWENLAWLREQCDAALSGGVGR